MLDRVGVVAGVNDFSKIVKVENQKDSNALSFDAVVNGLLNKVNDSQVKADNSIESFVRGDEGITMHEVMLNVKEGQMALEMATTLRNHVVEMYQEINRLQL